LRYFGFVHGAAVGSHDGGGFLYLIFLKVVGQRGAHGSGQCLNSQIRLHFLN
jgi:hypothetical protein